MTIDQRTNTLYADHYWGASVSAIEGATDIVTAEIDGIGSSAVPDVCYVTSLSATTATSTPSARSGYSTVVRDRGENGVDGAVARAPTKSRGA